MCPLQVKFMITLFFLASPTYAGAARASGNQRRFLKGAKIAPMVVLGDNQQAVFGVNATFMNDTLPMINDTLPVTMTGGDEGNFADGRAEGGVQDTSKGVKGVKGVSSTGGKGGKMKLDETLEIDKSKDEKEGAEEELESDEELIDVDDDESKGNKKGAREDLIGVDGENSMDDKKATREELDSDEAKSKDDKKAAREELDSDDEGGEEEV